MLMRVVLLSFLFPIATALAVEPPVKTGPSGDQPPPVDSTEATPGPTKLKKAKPKGDPDDVRKEIEDAKEKK